MVIRMVRNLFRESIKKEINWETVQDLVLGLICGLL